MERDKNGTGCRSSGRHWFPHEASREASPWLLPALQLQHSSRVRLDSCYLTAYLLLGTDKFTKHLPNYAKGNTSEGKTFPLLSPAHTACPWKQPRSLQEPRGCSQQDGISQLGKGKPLPMALPLGTYPTQPALCFVVGLALGVYFFCLSLVSIQLLVPY